MDRVLLHQPTCWYVAKNAVSAVASTSQVPVCFNEYSWDVAK